MKNLLLPLLICALATLVTAQEAKVIVQQPTTSRDVSAITTYYNEHEERTSVSTFVPVYIEHAEEFNTLEINAHFSYPGRYLFTSPETVQFVLSVPCVFGEYLNKADPVICIEGECRSFRPRDTGACEGSLNRERTSRMIDLPYETLVRMSNAGQVSIKISQTEISLTGGQIKVLRNLAGRMVPGRAAPPFRWRDLTLNAADAN